MSANINPIFPLTPVVSWGTVSSANTAKDGSGTQVTVFTAGTNGARVDKLNVRYTGTCVQTVLRIFLNNGSSNATPANNILYKELTIPACTLSETSAQIDSTLSLTLDMALPAGYKINVAIGTTVAAALQISCEGGDF